MTLVYIEVKREAGKSGDAQQQGMAYHLKDHATEAFMETWQTLRPALLITVQSVDTSHKHHAHFLLRTCSSCRLCLYHHQLISTFHMDLPCRLWGQVCVSLACAWMPLPQEYASRCHLPWTCYSCCICLTCLQVWPPCSALCPNW